MRPACPAGTWLAGSLPPRPIQGNAATHLRLAFVLGAALSLAPYHAAEVSRDPTTALLDDLIGEEQAEKPQTAKLASTQQQASDDPSSLLLDELLGEGQGQAEETKAVKWPSTWRQELDNYQDVQYTANLTIGNQVISGIIDTGSFELVVFEAGCDGCGRALQYNASISPMHSKGSISRGLFYGSGDVYATEAFDEVAMGPFPTVNQSFWQVYQATMSVLQIARFQSVVGIGPAQMPHAEAWHGIAAAVKDMKETVDAGSLPTKWQGQQVKSRLDFFKEVRRSPTMIDTFHISTFSMCLLNQPGGRGYFIWNDTVDVTQPKLFKRVNVIGRHTWTVNMTDVSVSPRSATYFKGLDLGCSQGCGAIVDSGTALVMMPAETVSYLQEHLKKIGGACANLDEMPDLAFKLDGQLFFLPPDAYLAEVDGVVPESMAEHVRMRSLEVDATGSCKLSVMESSSTTHWGPLWILGMPFFRKYYTSFHLGRSRAERALYISPASPDCTPEEVDPSEASLARSTRGRVVYRRQLKLGNMYTSPLAKKAMQPGSVVDL